MNNAPICAPKNPVVQSVENKSDVKKFTNAFVFVTSLNSVFYVDCAHRITIITSGIVSRSDYDVATNVENFRDQLLYDPTTQALVYFDVTGKGVVMNPSTMYSDFNTLLNRPSYAGNLMTGDTQIPAVPTKLADLEDGSEVATLREDVTALQARPTPVSLDALTSLDVESLADGVNLQANTTNTTTGTTGTSSIALPVVSTSVAGILTPAMLDELTQNSTDVTTLQTTVDNLSATVTATSNTVTGLQSNVEAQDTQIQDVISSVNTLETDLADLSSSVTNSLSTKQDILVSGTNIKTINGETLLGEGDITVSGGSGGVTFSPITYGSITPSVGKSLLNWVLTNLAGKRSYNTVTVDGTVANSEEVEISTLQPMAIQAVYKSSGGISRTFDQCLASYYRLADNTLIHYHATLNFSLPVVTAEDTEAIDIAWQIGTLTGLTTPDLATDSAIIQYLAIGFSS